MRGTLRKSVMAATALLIVAGTTVAVPNSASARWGGGWHGGGWHGGGWRGGGWGGGGWAGAEFGLGIGTGLLLAAALHAPYYGGSATPLLLRLRPCLRLWPLWLWVPSRLLWLWRLLPALSVRGFTPIVVITIGMVVTTQIVGTPTVENRTALAHRRKTAFAVFLFFACLQ